MKPPSTSKSLISDLLLYVLRKPNIKTQIIFNSLEERLTYNQRIMQRIGMNTNNFSVLNIHKIGIDAPVHYIFDELKYIIYEQNKN